MYLIFAEPYTELRNLDCKLRWLNNQTLFFADMFHCGLLITLSEDLCPELQQNIHERRCIMWAVYVLTASLGCIYTQLLSHIVSRWVAEKAAVSRSFPAVVEMKSQDSNGWPGLWRFLMGSAILVHCRACVSQSVHGWQGGHQENATFKQLKPKCQQT